MIKRGTRARLKKDETGRVQAHGETLEFWRAEIQRMKLAFDLWDAYLTGERNNLVEPIEKLASKRSRVPVTINSAARKVSRSPRI